jgi:hypothetical protein
MRKWTPFIVVLVWVLTIALAAGCTLQRDEEVGAISATYDDATGFMMQTSDHERLEVLAHGRELWVTSDGISGPLAVLPDNLEPGKDWPDLVWPENIEPGTRLAVHAVKDGQLEEYLGDVVVAAAPAEVGYIDQIAYVKGTTSTCFSWCGQNGCVGTSCHFCKVCTYPYTVCGDHVVNSRTKSSSFVCSGGPNANYVCPDCSGANYHYCYTTHFTTTCGHN